MPPRRKTVKKAAAVPKAEPEEQVTEPTPEPVSMDTDTPMETDAPKLSKKDQQLEKITNMSNVTAYAVVEKMTIIMNQFFASSSFKNEDGKMVAHFMNHKVVVENIDGFSIKDQKNVAADHLLKQIVGKGFEFLHDHQGATGSVSKDAEWYKEKKALQDTRNGKMIAMQLKSTENKPDGPEKTAKIERVTKKFTLSEEVPKIADIIDRMENCYFQPLEATCARYDVGCEVTYTKLKNNKEVKYDFTTCDMSKLETGKNINYKIRIDLTKEGIEGIAFEAEAKTVNTARSAAAMNCLQELIEKDIVENIYHSMQVAMKKKKLAIKTENIRKTEMAIKEKAKKKKANLKRLEDQKLAKEKKTAEKAQRKADNEMKSKKNKSPLTQNHMQGQMMQGQMMQNNMMMMPCVLGPNGQYIPMQQAQMMMMNGQQQMNGNAPQQPGAPGTGKKKNKKRKGKKPAAEETSEEKMMKVE